MSVFVDMLCRCVRLFSLSLLGVAACNQAALTSDPDNEPSEGSAQLRISEVMADNEGAWIDEWGEADDWIELTNDGNAPIELKDFEIADESDRVAKLDDGVLEPGESILLWADDEESQGPSHLPFKLGSEGERIQLFDPAGQIVDEVTVAPLDINEVYARFGADDEPLSVCRYASPGRKNPKRCTPPEPPSLVDESFEAFEFEEPYSVVTNDLVISELALRPASFVEIYNSGTAALDLGDFALWLAPQKPGEAWPVEGAGVEVPLPAETLRAGARIAVPISASHTSELSEDPLFEGVLTLFEKGETPAIDRVDFMHWPEDSSLSRLPDATGPFSFCKDTTPGEANNCDPLPSREIGDRDRHLRTPGDFVALAAGEPLVGIESVKFVVDLDAGGVVHLLGSERWALHYNFVREEIDHDPMLDRCDPVEFQEFYQGWVDFSVTEYFQVEGRRYLLGTLSRHAGTDLHAIEYTFGDAISPEQMRHGFYSVIAHTPDPTAWALRAQDQTQIDKARQIEGTLPVVGPNAPFVGMTYQPLTRGVAYGTLRFIPAAQLDSESFGRDTIIVTDDVPNDIPFVAGLITEAFQTPLAHVNVLSQNRNTPNAALRRARSDPRLEEHFDQLVRLEVTATDLKVRQASAAEVREYWDEHAVSGPAVAPRLDTSLRGVQPLQEHSLESIPQIGAKASQMAEMMRINTVRRECAGAVPINTPKNPFAIPVVHYLEHFEASGARAKLAELREDPDFDADPEAKKRGLVEVRRLIAEYPVESELLSEVMLAVQQRFGDARVRFRSSSNTEDLPTFNGAGLYTSISAELGDKDRRVDDAIRTVWASLWNLRAYDERRYANIDDQLIAMGVLVHPASLSDEANGVAVSRNVLDPNRGDIYYINVQAGEASVTNPAPGIATDQLIYRWPPRLPAVEYNSESSVLSALATQPEHVMSESEVRALACALSALHDWFRPKLDPNQENRWFAMETEFKLLDGGRELLLKQARPHSFGGARFSPDCREF